MIGRSGRAGIVQAGLALVLATGAAQAQIVSDASPPSGATQKAVVGYIAANSAPYRIEWSGSGGYFVQNAYAQEPARRIQLDYLHTQAGPSGYSKHLAWFIARDRDSFNILWLYLDAAGTDFGCWLYQYPSNRLTFQRFAGQYRFTPPTSPPAPVLFDGMLLNRPPRYTGPDFTFRDWTREIGTLNRLDLFVPPPIGPVVGTALAAPVGTPPKAPDRTLSALRVTPLHQIRVGEANGWRNGGWQELHCLAFDTSDDPYYLILYSNEATGFVVDIKHAQTYTANFGAKVQFSTDTTVTQQNNRIAEEGDLHVRRYDWHDFLARSAQKHVNPYTEVSLLGEFVGPNGKKVLVPGYWDGGDRWKLRFSPGLVGDWTWRMRSNDPDLDGIEGVFECVAVDGKERAFFGVNPDRSRRRHFATREGKPVFPMALHDPVFNVSPDALRANGPRAIAVSGSEETAVPASFAAFQKRVDAWSAQGVNRFVGGFLLDHDTFAAKTQANEGGPPFVGYDLDHPNPEFFYWMDRRIAYCNQHGIVPDIGFGWPAGGMFKTYTDEQLRRFWLSIVARYAAMDVSWNLFGDDGQPLPDGAEARIASFAGLTHLYDPGRHALTVMRKGSLVPAYKIIEDASALGDAARKLPPVPAQPAQPIPTVIALPDYPWLDYTTLVGGSPQALDLLTDLDKPIVVWEDSGVPSKREAVAPEITRHAMWETRMRNAYWVGAADGLAAVDTPDVKMATDCAAFFRQTKWWRLVPHPEMLTGKTETKADRRRRLKIEQQSLNPTEGGQPLNPDLPPGGSGQPPAPSQVPGGRQFPGGGQFPGDSQFPGGQFQGSGRFSGGGGQFPGGATRPAGPQFLLSDPGKEYVVYLERGGRITLDLIDAPGRVRFVWFNPRTGKSLEQPDQEGGDYTVFVAPDNEDWVLYLSRR
ncbi:MAG: putative glycosyl hydrolase [Chthonomonadaceae bacterium]|nr:putative glycosyl hydrolase [Chthonomonadaceae bacterium]